MRNRFGGINKMSSEDFKRFEEITLRILEYVTKAVPFEVHHVERAIKDIKELERSSGINVPLRIYELLSDLYEILAKRYITCETSKAADFYKKAIKIREKILVNKLERQQCAEVLSNLGLTYGSLAEVRDPEENSQKSIKAYNEALAIRTKEDFPIDYAMTQNNLGAAYDSLAKVRDPEENLRKAIKALNEALVIRTKEDFPIDYAMTQENLERLLAKKSAKQIK